MSTLRGTAPAHGIVTPVMVRLLSGTRWCAIVFALGGWISAALSMIVAAILFLVSIGRGDAEIASMATETLQMNVIRATAYVYLAAALVMMIPALHLTRNALALGALRRSEGERDAAEALFHERRLWKFYAITTLAVIGLSMVGAVALLLKG